MGDSGGWRPHVLALAGYVLVALGFSWPLSVHLGTHLTGSPAGDTGVYVWNQWVFQHEILERASLPYSTDAIFSLHGGASLGLHNYTPFQNLVALPLMGWLGVVATFNVVYLLMTIATAYATFLLAREVTRHDAESWMAGVLFAWSPVLVTRGASHFSLVAAAPLAVFLLVLLRAGDKPRLSHGVALGATAAWAAASDVYYAIYCLELAALFLLVRTVGVRRHTPTSGRRSVPRTLDALLLCAAVLVASILATGGWQFGVFGADVSMRSLYTPMLVLTLLAATRLAWPYRFSLTRGSSPMSRPGSWGLTPSERQDWWRTLRVAAVAGACAALLLSPLLYAIGTAVADGSWRGDRIFWRTSPPGVDLAAYVLPNPNHPLAPDALRAWLTPRPDAYFENVASITFVALVVMLIAWRTGWRPPRLWAVLAVAFGAMALGPFVQVAGMNTLVPGPWALLRYVPIVGATRTPARFTVVLMLALAILFASALVWLGRRSPGGRRLILAVAAAVLFLELLPAPRPLYSAAMPTVYRHVAAAPGDSRLLELPFGVRDGTSSVGNFTARSQFYQTMHGKRLIGGYLSRVSPLLVQDIRRDPMLDALFELSEGMPLDPARREALLEEGPRFVERADLGFVIVDRQRASAALRDFAIRTLRLQLIDSDGEIELYGPVIAEEAATASF